MSFGHVQSDIFEVLYSYQVFTGGTRLQVMLLN